MSRKPRGPARMLPSGLLAVGTVAAAVALGATPAQAIITPDPGSTAPPPVGSAAYCLSTTTGTINRSAATTPEGGTITLTWNVKVADRCSVTPSVVGVGLSGGLQLVDDAGSMSVTVPYVTGDTSWSLRITALGGSSREAARTTTTVIAPQ